VDCVLRIDGQPPRIVEVDEKQHFNQYRAMTLKMSAEVPVAFDRGEWIRRCEAKTELEGVGFGRPKPPLFPGEAGRHQQRAFRDALTDILPLSYGFHPTLRIGYFDVVDWIESEDAPRKMNELLNHKFECSNEKGRVLP
jgi:hypothetical protein